MFRKTLLLLVVFFSVAALTCKAGQSSDTLGPKAGMFKVTVLYPGGDDKTFDMDYYEKKHMPMVAAFIGKNLYYYEINKGLSGRTPNDKPPFMASGYFYVRDIAEYNKAIGQNRDAIVNDFKNYTNVQPVVYVSEISFVRK